MPPTLRRSAWTTSQSSSRHFTPLVFFAFLIPLLTLLSPYTSLLSRKHHLGIFDSLQTPILGDGASRALLVTAHPDDEVMFFSPTILSLIQEGWEVSGLCLSSGNDTGLGTIRKQELYGSYETLGVSRDRVKVIDHPDLQDSMSVHWDPALILNIVENHLNDHSAELIITFDEKGITNHPNHMAISKALSQTFHNKSIRLLHLKSPALLFKFTGPLYPIYLNILSILSRITGRENFAEKHMKFVVLSTSSQWYQSIQAMLSHKTQLVWFRWLYLTFSQLMWVNELKII
ncbi:uncharacterized protein I206_102251 [Kwoniella pini CBS 10737]|uniref:N-acetylglucosaminylphosphatidylinositol deacetylase n=1 Tax=Kwoniella pini CBS 10737 TaxID=1296096 RepID=A0A1B9HSZ4_9TREE|nr:uncharacterized protein I206_07621 [Kwoniella pini CBS 10737]OCF46387.1 hypothetical protein I206_07621 [Kwoniella pini CBS 10737]